MNIDPQESAYQERAEAAEEFDADELRHCRLILRRLQFLEKKVKETGGLAAGNATGGAAFAEWEVMALSWILSDIGFIEEIKR